MRKRADTKGLAAIIDSMMFVCIIGVIAMMILESPSKEEEGSPWDRSAMAHSVLVHGTTSITERDDEGPSSEAPVCELLCEALGSGNQSLMDRLAGMLEPVSDALIEPPWHYRWVVLGAGNEIAMGEDMLPDSCDISASTIEIHEEGSFTSVFYLWIL